MLYKAIATAISSPAINQFSLMKFLSSFIQQAINNIIITVTHTVTKVEYTIITSLVYIKSFIRYTVSLFLMVVNSAVGTVTITMSLTDLCKSIKA